jgi:hypothetical protein
MTMEDRVKAALAAHPADKRLHLLASGYSDAWKACVQARTASNLRELETWEAKLAGCLDALDQTKAEASSPRELPDPLQNLHQVWQYLQSLGYSVSKAQPKRDLDAKKLIPLKSGGFSQASVRRYALACKLKRTDPAPGSPDTAAPSALPLDDVGAGAEKIAQQARLARLQADKIELALERDKGNLVPAADLAITLASFAAVVEHELKNTLRTQAGKLIALVEGNAQRKAVLSRALVDAVDGGLRHAASIEEYRVQFESLGDARP